MKKVLLFSVVTLVLFGLSFGVSYFVQKMKTQPTSADGSDKGKAPEGGKAPAAPTKTALRPPFTPGADEAVQLAKSLQERQTQLREDEKRLNLRRERLELVQKTIKEGQDDVDKLRDDLKQEFVRVKEAMSVLEKQRAEIDQQRRRTSSDLKEMQGRILDLEKDERKNFEKMATMYDTMAPESAAKILEQLADTGKMDTAVKLLGLMKERTAAKVLAELSDPKLAAQLLDRLKSLKRPPAGAATPAPAEPIQPPLPEPRETPKKDKDMTGRLSRYSN